MSNHPVGTLDEQAATVMHEFGHNLKLRHRGNFDLPNCEPNYFSVMNYAFQFSNWVSNRPLDYSRSALATLDIELLNERKWCWSEYPAGSDDCLRPSNPGRGLVPPPLQASQLTLISMASLTRIPYLRVSMCKEMAAMERDRQY